MASNIRSTYQAQLPFQHLYTNSKQQILAKYWIESVLGYRLPSNDLSCLKDGIILYKIIQALISHHFLPTDYQVKSNAQQPVSRG
ncbi:hypothetical protein BDF20DRAFT_863869 [Mycotypha africana]|uniref:uncharacterized protein n=1 Tax=Mycotypha africana TaxID=64632 RepID=UPI0022FFF2C6|nr:uncharacterized protein BDF20DRAFT_863869 [Mycotypha africana]KAI8981904.1 hypothetical protein BDF20DRAFT_863869 [Mycotypha africana]